MGSQAPGTTVRHNWPLELSTGHGSNGCRRSNRTGTRIDVVALKRNSGNHWCRHWGVTGVGLPPHSGWDRSLDLRKTLTFGGGGVGSTSEFPRDFFVLRLFCSSETFILKYRCAPRPESWLSHWWQYIRHLMFENPVFWIVDRPANMQYKSFKQYRTSSFCQGIS